MKTRNFVQRKMLFLWYGAEFPQTIRFSPYIIGYFSLASTLCPKEDRGEGLSGTMDIEEGCWNRA